MAHDPLHKPKTRKERRKFAQDACREQPCNKVEFGKEPPCIVCVHEGKVK